MKTIRVVLVDDSRDFLEMARRLLHSDPAIEIVGSALTGATGRAEVARLRPDLVLMDVSLPDASGFTVTHEVKRAAEPPRVLVVTLHDTPDYRSAAALAGADGFVAKSDAATTLLDAIHEIFPVGAEAPASRP